LRIVKGPNVKKLLTLATLAAVIGSTALPAGAASVTVNTPNVTVKWNIAVSAALNFNTDYTVAAGSSAQGTTSPSIFGSDNGTAYTGASGCAGPGAAPAANTVDFGNITPSSVDYIDCYYVNAADAMITTNSTSWNVTEGLSAAMPTGYSLCVVPNGFTWAATNPASLNATASAATQTTADSGGYFTNKSTGGCGASTQALSTTAATIMTDNAAFTSGQGAHLGEDYILVVPPLASKGNGTATVVYTITAT
jgi:hypothetical protein